MIFFFLPCDVIRLHLWPGLTQVVPIAHKRPNLHAMICPSTGENLPGAGGQSEV